MSYYLQIGGESEPTPLASNRGLGDLYRWIDTLDATHYGEIVHLAEWGWCQRLAVLQAQLEDALSGDDAPTQHDVRATADNLLDLIKSRDAGAQTCHVTDGIGAGNGEDDDESDDQDGDDGPDDDEDETEDGDDEAGDESGDETHDAEDEDEDDEPTTKAIVTKGKMIRTTTPMPTGETIAAALREIFAEQRDEIASRLATKSLEHVETEFAEAVQKAEPKPDGEYYPWQTCAADQFGAKVAAFVRVTSAMAKSAARAVVMKGKYKFSSTQVNLVGLVADAMLAWGQSIPDDDLAEDGRESNPHVTVKYGLHAEDPAEVAKAIVGESPITLTIGKAKIFAADESRPSDVIVLDIDSDDLHRINAKIAAACEHTDTYPEYHPHATIAYVKPGVGKRYEGNDSLAGQTIVVSSIVFSSRSGDQFEIPLTGGLSKAVLAKAANEFDEHEVDADTAAALSEVAHVPAVPMVDLSAWDVKMAARVAPLIEVVMRDSVKAMADVIVNSDPKAIEAMFHVVDKNLPETAQRLALKFCRETNETTSMEIGDALATLRDEIEAGIVGGDTRVEMTSRVREVFDNAEKFRAERIARTEASRARHTAEQKTVTATGDEYKKHWLASADACEKCDGVVAKFPGGIPASATFGVTSYGPIDGPPLHPHCGCSLTWERIESPDN